MDKYTFRSKYYINDITEAGSILGAPKFYYSPISSGNGTISNPAKVPAFPSSGSFILFLANGTYRPFSTACYDTNSANYILGGGMASCILEQINLYLYFRRANSITFNNLTFKYGIIGVSDVGTTNMNFYKCCVQSKGLATNFTPMNLNRCVIEIPNNISYVNDQGYNSYLYTDIVNIINANALYDNCKVTLDSQARLTTYKDTWASFNDCKFKIGAESDWTTLTGGTGEELRANFVARCQAQGFTVPVGTDVWDTNLPMYRWVFATNSAKNGVPLKNGIINNFEKRKSQTFGYETKRDGFVISIDATAKNSFNPKTPNSVTPNAGIEFDTHSLSLASSTDITDKVTATSQSNIMWLGGKYKLTALDVVHNMPAEFGVMVDSTSTIDFTPVATGSIEADELYLVRSTDKNYAAITYNGVVYNTALSSNNFVFKGVKDKTGFTSTAGNPVVYKLTDFVQHQTLEMRVVNKLPAEKIKSGILKSNYWYFVEHDSDQANTTDYITYNGEKYFAGSSFLVQEGVTSFGKSTESIHLRRAWADDFNYETMPNTDEDKEFWRYEQKPRWCKIVIGDTPRCFMAANSDRENEMKSKDNEYLTTGHPDFYKMENGDGGLKIPSFSVQGSFIQLRMMITTTNPM